MPASKSRKAARAANSAAPEAAAEEAPAVAAPAPAAVAAAPSAVATASAHDYTRDLSCTAPLANEQRVHELIAQRLQAKKAREFARADELRGVLLRECGVEVFDAKKFWKVVAAVAPDNTAAAATAQQQQRQPAARDGAQHKLPVVAAASLSAAHGYTRAGSDTARVADEPRVHALLLQRLQAKKSHEFERADALREELLREHGVEIFDKTKFWRVAGGRGHVPLPDGESKPRSTPPKAAVAAAAAASVHVEAPPSREAAKALRKQEEAAAASIAETPIATGFGHEMLLKMGWGGQGNGLRDGALAEPFQVMPAEADKIAKAGRRGLAADDDASQAAGAADMAEGEAVASEAKKKKKRKATAIEGEDHTSVAAVDLAPPQAPAPKPSFAPSGARGIVRGAHNPDPRLRRPSADLDQSSAPTSGQSVAEVRQAIAAAVEREDYAAAAELKKSLDAMGAIMKRAEIRNAIAAAVEREDYAAAAELKKSLDSLGTPAAAPQLAVAPAAAPQLAVAPATAPQLAAAPAAAPKLTVGPAAAPPRQWGGQAFGSNKRPRDAPGSCRAEPPPRAHAPPAAQSFAAHPALETVRGLKRSDQSLTAKQVHALLPERGFELSLSTVKKLCSEAHGL